MLRRLHTEQPDSFAFTPANRAWADAQISKYPAGREASAIIPLLWRAQEQEGWLSKPAIEHVADMLGLAYIRALEVATFYFMFQLQPVGSVAHVQICGTTSCMICGAEDLIAVCKDKIAASPHKLSADGKFSWEEVECLGACANAPMAQIGKDYYEDLTVERMAEILDELAAGNVPVPGPQNGRFAAEPLSGLTSLKVDAKDRTDQNASVALALDLSDTVKRIDGTEVPLVAPWGDAGGAALAVAPVTSPKPANDVPAGKTGVDKPEAQVDFRGKPETGKSAGGAARIEAGVPPAVLPSTALPGQAELATRKGSWRFQGARAPEPAAKSVAKPAPAKAEEAAAKPAGLDAPRDGGADDLKKIKGVGPKLEQLLHTLGYFHFDQIANWTAAEIAWVDENLQGFRGRVTRDDWVPQASLLASGQETEFSKRAKY